MEGGVALRGLGMRTTARVLPVAQHPAGLQGVQLTARQGGISDVSRYGGEPDDLAVIVDHSTRLKP